MAAETVTLQIPEILYQRLVNTAHAQRRPIEEVIVHALQVGSPPEWDDKVESLTTIGRATIVCLRMNNPVIVAARRRWTISGWHPPDD